MVKITKAEEKLIKNPRKPSFQPRIKKYFRTKVYIGKAKNESPKFIIEIRFPLAYSSADSSLV